MTMILMEKSAYAQMTFAQINAGVRTLSLDEAAQEQSLRALGLRDRIARVLKVYAGLKPFLIALSLNSLLPATWRAAIVLFIQALDALAAAGEGTVTIPEQQFKAGKDQAGRKRGASLTFRPIRKVARDARDGRFTTQADAHRRPATTVVEQVKYPARPASRKR